MEFICCGESSQGARNEGNGFAPGLQDMSRSAQSNPSSITTDFA